ncbi:hypothetical protein KY336_00915 [Candidatus Woesearchaeota archaeon]|nr:hypothetical protein [Candidatus Woesearchaeota archaeon]
MARGKILTVRPTATGQSGVIEPLRGANLRFFIRGGDFKSGEKIEFKMKAGKVTQVTRIGKGSPGRTVRTGKTGWGRMRTRRDARSYN